MADKEATERRVYVLPAELVERIKAYQTDQGISSEVEAARRLLDSALQMRDTVPALLTKLKSRHVDEKDLRILARDILATHALVDLVRFEPKAVQFWLRDETRGRMETDGSTYIGEGPIHNEDDWSIYPPPARTTARAASGSPSWDTKRGGDLDDEIPF